MAFEKITPAKKGMPRKANVSVYVCPGKRRGAAKITVANSVLDAIGTEPGKHLCLYIGSGDDACSFALKSSDTGFKLTASRARAVLATISAHSKNFPHIPAGTRVDYDVAYRDGMAICRPVNTHVVRPSIAAE